MYNPYSWQNKKFPPQIFGWLITAKNIAGGNAFCFSNLGQVTKFNPQIQDFKRALD